MDIEEAKQVVRLIEAAFPTAKVMIPGAGSHWQVEAVIRTMGKNKGEFDQTFIQAHPRNVLGQVQLLFESYQLEEEHHDVHFTETVEGIIGWIGSVKSRFFKPDADFVATWDPRWGPEYYVEMPYTARWCWGFGWLQDQLQPDRAKIQVKGDFECRVQRPGDEDNPRCQITGSYPARMLSDNRRFVEDDLIGAATFFETRAFKSLWNTFYDLPHTIMRRLQEKPGATCILLHQQTLKDLDNDLRAGHTMRGLFRRKPGPRDAGTNLHIETADGDWIPFQVRNELAIGKVMPSFVCEGCWGDEDQSTEFDGGPVSIFDADPVLAPRSLIVPAEVPLAQFIDRNVLDLMALLNRPGALQAPKKIPLPRDLGADIVNTLHESFDNYMAVAGISPQTAMMSPATYQQFARLLSQQPGTLLIDSHASELTLHGIRLVPHPGLPDGEIWLTS